MRNLKINCIKSLLLGTKILGFEYDEFSNCIFILNDKKQVILYRTDHLEIDQFQVIANN